MRIGKGILIVISRIVYYFVSVLLCKIIPWKKPRSRWITRCSQGQVPNKRICSAIYFQEKMHLVRVYYVLWNFRKNQACVVFMNLFSSFALFISCVFTTSCALITFWQISLALRLLDTVRLLGTLKYVKFEKKKYLHCGYIFARKTVCGVRDEHARFADRAVTHDDTFDRTSRGHVWPLSGSLKLRTSL